MGDGITGIQKEKTVTFLSVNFHRQPTLFGKTQHEWGVVGYELFRVVGAGAAVALTWLAVR